MLSPLVSSTLISTGGSLLGGLLGKKKKAGTQDYWNNVQQKFSREQFNEQKSQYDRAEKERASAIQTRVADAKAAGLHPLFALGGAAPGGSPTISMSGGYTGSQGYDHSSGSALGTGIAEAGRGLASYVRNKDLKKSQQELHTANLRRINAAAQRDELEAMRTASEIKRAEQKATQTFPDPTHAAWLTGTRGQPLSQRKLQNDPNRSIPIWAEGMGKDAQRYLMMNPDFADELSQLFNAVAIPVQNWWRNSPTRKWLGGGR